MFGIGGWEFVIIVGLALLLFGPDKLPQLARTAGRFMADFKRYQSMMESTIKAEMFTMEPDKQPDPFEKGKEFRERVVGTGIEPAKPAGDEAVSGEAAPADAESAAEPASATTDSAPTGDEPENATADEVATEVELKAEAAAEVAEGGEEERDKA